MARVRTTGVSTALQWLGVWAAATLLLTLAGLLNRAAWCWPRWARRHSAVRLADLAGLARPAPGCPPDALYRASGQAAVDAMGGVEFEHHVAAVLRGRGYTIGVTRATGDFGVDLIAT